MSELTNKPVRIGFYYSTLMVEVKNNERSISLEFAQCSNFCQSKTCVFPTAIFCSLHSSLAVTLPVPTSLNFVIYNQRELNQEAQVKPSRRPQSCFMVSQTTLQGKELQLSQASGWQKVSLSDPYNRQIKGNEKEVTPWGHSKMSCYWLALSGSDYFLNFLKISGLDWCCFP